MRAPSTIDLDAVDAAALARQKRLATALLGVCAVTYASARAFESRAVGLSYVAAFAEAAIIGGLADWYAIVALFRHPLGLKLPHTAIIPARQERIGEAIGSFIARHFLASERVEAKIIALDPAASGGRWLAEPANRREVAAYAARLMPDLIAAIDREALHEEIERAVIERLAALDLADLGRAALEVATRDGRHHAILDAVLDRIAARLAEPMALSAMRERVRAELPTLFQFFLADAYVLQRLVRASHVLLTQVREDADHPLRAEFDRLIAEFLVQLKSSPEHRGNALKQELLARVKLREIVTEAFERLLAALRSDVGREHGIVRRGLESFLDRLAQRLERDRGLRERINQRLAAATAALTQQHRDEVGAFISAQVRSWDAAHAVATIERSVGKDLQYVRLNGTLVGGLLGLAIFILTRLVMS